MSAVEFIYRCRKCNQEFVDCCTDAKLGILILNSIIEDKPMPRNYLGRRPNMITLHTCKDGKDRKGIGIADLLGTSKKELK